MQTSLSERYRNSDTGREADQVLRSCVHCGFCNATCPTYQLLGDELDGPRGRIYQIKQVLEGQPATTSLQHHLDRCLTCRACETTCPSGVQYHRLLDIGRELVEREQLRTRWQRLQRRMLIFALASSRRAGLLFAVARRIKPLLPSALANKIPQRRHSGSLPGRTHARRMLLLDGCVQPATAPHINAAAKRVFDRLGIELLSVNAAGCCGALPHHLGDTDSARRLARANIDAWWPHVQDGAEAVVMTASGCAPSVKDYGYLLRNDKRYAKRAQHIGMLARDVSEVLAHEDLSPLPRTAQRIAFHSPCSLQHAQQLNGVVERILRSCGFELTRVRDSHLCCGSAGTYSILQPQLSSRLLDDRLKALQEGQPQLIATANIGCLMQLQSASKVPVRHWIELLDEAAVS